MRAHAAAGDGETGLTAKTILQALYPIERIRGQHLPPDGYDDLREAIELLVRTRPGSMPDASQFGFELGKLRGRVVGGHKLEVTPTKTRSGANRRQVVATNGGVE